MIDAGGARGTAWDYLEDAAVTKDVVLPPAAARRVPDRSQHHRQRDFSKHGSASAATAPFARVSHNLPDRVDVVTMDAARCLSQRRGADLCRLRAVTRA